MNADGQAVHGTAVNGGGHYRANGAYDGARGRPVISNHNPAYPAKGAPAPTTAVTRQNTASSSHTISTAAEPVELLRQTLESAPNSRPSSRSSSRKRTSLIRSSTVYTNGSADDSDFDSPRQDFRALEHYAMRHGFEDEYNSEDYLAVLEQVWPLSCLTRTHTTFVPADDN
jgi:hypothetical protein